MWEFTVWGSPETKPPLGWLIPGHSILFRTEHQRVKRHWTSGRWLVDITHKRGLLTTYPFKQETSPPSLKAPNHPKAVQVLGKSLPSAPKPVQVEKGLDFIWI